MNEDELEELASDLRDEASRGLGPLYDGPDLFDDEDEEDDDEDSRYYDMMPDPEEGDYDFYDLVR